MIALAAGVILQACSVFAETGVVTVPAKARKKDSEWTPMKTATIEAVRNLAPGRAAGRSGYGGREDLVLSAGGFFRVQEYGGRRWLVDPDGYAFLIVGVNGVAPDWSPDSRAAYRKKYGSRKDWAARTDAGLRDAGFNTAGHGSEFESLREAGGKMAYTREWGMLAGFRRKIAGARRLPVSAAVLNSGFERYCRARAKDLAETRDDPWLVGHFSDREVPFRLEDLEGCLALEEEHPIRRKAMAWLNRQQTGQRGPGHVSDSDREAFLLHVAETYFRIVAAAMRENDPNHLLLGIGVCAKAREFEVLFRAAGEHCDVVSVSGLGVWTPDPRRIARWARWAGRPILITEMSARAADSGLKNDTGAGWLVPTQKDRGAFYQNFAIGLLRSPDCVGWHWLKYMDDDPKSGTSSNSGILSHRYDPYPEVVAAMKELNGRAYALRDFLASSVSEEPAPEDSAPDEEDEGVVPAERETGIEMLERRSRLERHQ